MRHEFEFEGQGVILTDDAEREGAGLFVSGGGAEAGEHWGRRALQAEALRLAQQNKRLSEALPVFTARDPRDASRAAMVTRLFRDAVMSGALGEVDEFPQAEKPVERETAVILHLAGPGEIYQATRVPDDAVNARVELRYSRPVPNKEGDSVNTQPESARCSQCGKDFEQPACGPTHAVVANERRTSKAEQARVALWRGLSLAQHQICGLLCGIRGPHHAFCAAAWELLHKHGTPTSDAIVAEEEAASSKGADFFDRNEESLRRSWERRYDDPEPTVPPDPEAVEKRWEQVKREFYRPESQPLPWHPDPLPFKVQESAQHPWFHGLTFEEVRERLRTDRAPGKAIEVPPGFMDWLVRQKPQGPVVERLSQTLGTLSVNPVGNHWEVWVHRDGQFPRQLLTEEDAREIARRCNEWPVVTIRVGALEDALRRHRAERDRLEAENDALRCPQRIDVPLSAAAQYAPGEAGLRGAEQVVRVMTAREINGVLEELVAAKAESARLRGILGAIRALHGACTEATPAFVIVRDLGSLLAQVEG